MRKVIIIIEKSSDYYGAYAKDEDIPIFAAGGTVEECKQSVLDSIENLEELNERNRPNFLDNEFEIIYQEVCSEPATEPIKTEEDYQIALKKLGDIFGAEKNTPEGDEAEILVHLVDEYEKEHYPIDPPDFKENRENENPQNLET